MVINQEGYSVEEYHELIVSTQDAYDKKNKEYVTIPKVIKNIYLMLDTDYQLFNFFENSNKEISNVVLRTKVKKTFSTQEYIFEKFSLDDVENNYILELNSIGVKKTLNDLTELEKDLLSMTFKSLEDLKNYLLKNKKVDFLCEVYDSNFIKIKTKSPNLLGEIKNVLIDNSI